MLAVYHFYAPSKKEEPCSICFDPLDEEAIAHGEENFHPACKKCALAWFSIRPICPICRGSADISSVCSFSEKALLWLQDVGNKAERGAERMVEARGGICSIFSAASLMLISAWGAWQAVSFFPPEEETATAILKGAASSFLGTVSGIFMGAVQRGGEGGDRPRSWRKIVRDGAEVAGVAAAVSLLFSHLSL